MWDSDRWSPGLRQGDVLGEIFFPSLAARVGVTVSVRSLVEEASGPIEVVQVQGTKKFVIVLSHDCEFNEDKRNRLLVARIDSVPTNLTEEERQSLRESNDVEARAAAGKAVDGIDSFVLARVPGAFDEERIAVFTTATPLPMKMRDELVRTKRAEMTQEHRVLFREKIAWFFGRKADDIDDAEKFDAPRPATGQPNA
jgi:hypothetical protein